MDSEPEIAALLKNYFNGLQGGRWLITSKLFTHVPEQAS